MRSLARLGLLIALTAGAGGLAQLSSAQEKRWAAIDPNNEASSQVVWGPTEAEARQRAVEACRRISKTCANGPASTEDLNDTFAVMCCTQPRAGCAVSPGGGRQEAQKSVQKTLADAGYSNCTLRHYFSAASGKKQ